MGSDVSDLGCDSDHASPITTPTRIGYRSSCDLDGIRGGDVSTLSSYIFMNRVERVERVETVETVETGETGETGEKSP